MIQKLNWWHYAFSIAAEAMQTIQSSFVKKALLPSQGPV